MYCSEPVKSSFNFSVVSSEDKAFAPRSNSGLGSQGIGVSVIGFLHSFGNSNGSFVALRNFYLNDILIFDLRCQNESKNTTENSSTKDNSLTYELLLFG